MGISKLQRDTKISAGLTGTLGAVVARALRQLTARRLQVQGHSKSAHRAARSESNDSKRNWCFDHSWHDYPLIFGYSTREIKRSHKCWATITIHWERLQMEFRSFNSSTYPERFTTCNHTSGTENLKWVNPPTKLRPSSFGQLQVSTHSSIKWIYPYPASWTNPYSFKSPPKVFVIV